MNPETWLQIVDKSVNQFPPWYSRLSCKTHKDAIDKGNLSASVSHFSNLQFVIFAYPFVGFFFKSPQNSISILVWLSP